MRQFLLILSVSILINACRKETSGTLNPVESSKQLNVSYGEDPAQKMDIYLPGNRNDSTLLAVMIHGGSWSNGDKSEFNGYIPELQKRLPRLAFANVNYRLVNGINNRFPAQEEDIQRVMSFLQSKVSEFNISNKVVLMGVSAGAQLALLQGYKHNDEVQPKAIISLFGPTDFADLYTNPINPATRLALIGITGYSLDQNPTIYAEASPINYVTESSAPTLILQGALDSIVSVNQQLMLKAKLEEKNVPVELVIYPKAGHGFKDSTLTDALDRIRDFVLTYDR